MSSEPEAQFVSPRRKSGSGWWLRAPLAAAFAACATLLIVKHRAEQESLGASRAMRPADAAQAESLSKKNAANAVTQSATPRVSGTFTAEGSNQNRFDATPAP